MSVKIQLFKICGQAMPRPVPFPSKFVVDIESTAQGQVEIPAAFAICSFIRRQTSGDGNQTKCPSEVKEFDTLYTDFAICDSDDAIASILHK